MAHPQPQQYILDDPAAQAAIERGLDQIAQIRALKKAWRDTLSTLQRFHGRDAVRAVEMEIERRQQKLDLEVLRRHT